MEWERPFPDLSHYYVGPILATDSTWVVSSLLYFQPQGRKHPNSGILFLFLAPARNADFGFTVVCLHLAPHQAGAPPEAHRSALLPPAALAWSRLAPWPPSWQRPKTTAGNLVMLARSEAGGRDTARGGGSRAGLARLGSIRRARRGGCPGWAAASTNALSACAPRGARGNCRPTSAGTVPVDLASFDEGERASSQECRPVCTRKPGPSPRGVAGRLAARPHLTWADTGNWNEAWPRGPGRWLQAPSQPRSFPTCEGVGFPTTRPGAGRRGGGEKLQRQRKAGDFPLGVHRPASRGRCSREPNEG